MKKICSIISVLMMTVLCLVGCSDNGEKFIGKWECEEMYYQGIAMDSTDLGIPIEMVLQLEFKEDNTGEMIVIGGDNEQFEWKAENDSFKVNIGGEEVTVSRKEDNLNVTQCEGEYVTEFTLVKVDEFTEADIEELSE